MPIDRALENQWDKQLEDGLPDCRLKNREKRLVTRGRMVWEVVYCANCGEPYGLVIANMSPHVFAICNQCADRFGNIPNAQRVPEEIEKQIVAERRAIVAAG